MIIKNLTINKLLKKLNLYILTEVLLINHYNNLQKLLNLPRNKIFQLKLFQINLFTNLSIIIKITTITLTIIFTIRNKVEFEYLVLNKVNKELLDKIFYLQNYYL